MNFMLGVLYKLGVDKVVFPESDTATRLAYSLNNESANIIDYIKMSKDYKMIESYPIEEWIDKKIKELNIRN